MSSALLLFMLNSAYFWMGSFIAFISLSTGPCSSEMSQINHEEVVFYHYIQHEDTIEGRNWLQYHNIIKVNKEIDQSEACVQDHVIFIDQ